MAAPSQKNAPADLPAECCYKCRFVKLGDYYSKHNCQRNPPSPQDGVRWPHVKPTDWCGEFKPKPEVKDEQAAGNDGADAGVRPDAPVEARPDQPVRV